LLLLSGAVLWLIFFGCQGDPGKSGVGLLPEDIWAPEVTIILPIAARSIYDRVALEAYTIDDVGVDSVQFLIDGATPRNADLIARAEPWQLVWDCTVLNEGMHTVQARAWDGSGKCGLSPVVLVEKVDPSQKPSEATLKTYIDTGDERDWLFWMLPDDYEEYNGYGVRFVPDGPCRIERFEVKVYWDTSWAGNRKFAFEVWDSKRSRPDSLIFADTTSLARTRATKGDISNLRFVRGNERVYASGEFFVLITPAEELPGDSLAIITDDGQWRNYHGFARRGSEWVNFTAGSYRAYNPHISAVVVY